MIDGIVKPRLSGLSTTWAKSGEAFGDSNSPQAKAQALPDRLVGVDPTVVQRDQSLPRFVNFLPWAGTLIDGIVEPRLSGLSTTWAKSGEAVGDSQSPQAITQALPDRLVGVDPTVVQRDQSVPTEF